VVMISLSYKKRVAVCNMGADKDMDYKCRCKDRGGDRTSNCSETSQVEVAGMGEILDVF